MNTRRMVVIAAAGAMAALTQVAVATDDHGHEVSIKDKQFSPAEEIVTVGETLTWVHDDPDEFHTVTADDGSFDSNPGCAPDKTKRCMKEGGVFRHTFDAVGEFRYYSKLHGGPGGKGASGLIKVVPEGEEPEHHDH